MDAVQENLIFLWALPPGNPLGPHSEDVSKIPSWFWEKERKSNHYEICSDPSPQQRPTFQSLCQTLTQLWKSVSPILNHFSLVSPKNKTMVNSGQGSKEIDWECCCQVGQLWAGGKRLSHWRNTCESHSLNT